ncbi:response regulator [Ruminococcus sp. AM41-10BH]|nr:response regulator [Ruminococcus sp. AM41-10BH]
MIYAVLLCNKEWNIVKIKQNVSGLSLKPGDCLADVVQDADELTENDEKQYSLFLTFRENGMTLSTLVRSFQEGNLVILSHVRSDADFVEFNNEYLDFVEWVENHLEGFYHSEYFQIQKLNNQLIDSQRALIRSKRNLEMALEENKKINRKISEARQAAEQASRSKTQFLANMSHDIRTPMNGIIGMLNIADRYVDNPDEVKKYHQKIRMASEYLLSLINDVLDMRKIDQKDIMLLEESVNLRDVIENCRDILEAKAGEQEITLDTTGMAEFNPPQLMASEVHLRQIFMNIISNAIKYNKYGGKIFIQAIVLEQTEDKVICRFSVTDTGIGMSEDFQKQMFEPFTQEHGENRSEFKGTGLGLSIVKRIIEEMGGEIRVESELDIGTKFSWDLTFPIDKAINERAENIPDRIVTLRGIRVLAAEDNSLNSEILKFILEDMGINVNLVENGELAVKAFEESRPGEYAMILMDIMMPVMDGYEASRIIRNMKRPDAAKIPIIALTANAFAEDIVRSSEAGMDAHITKPIDENKLKECMLRLLASR